MEPRFQHPYRPFLSYREAFRLVSMVTLLVLIGMAIYHNRSEKLQDSAPIATKSEVPFVETVLPGPNDQQPFELSQAEYQFQAITDKVELSREEMPSYWRLMKWSLTESYDDLKKRALTDCYFTHLGQSPEKYRGKLIALKLSLRRSASFPAPENSVGAKTVYEAWGVTEESRGNFYCLVFHDKPPELPIHPDVHEEAEFVGYFLKLLTYQDPMDKTRWAPLLIGRIQWKENAARAGLKKIKNSTDFWTWGAIGILVVLVMLTRRYIYAAPLRTTEAPNEKQIHAWLDTGKPASGEEGLAREGPVEFEKWLENADGSNEDGSTTTKNT